MEFDFADTDRASMPLKALVYGPPGSGKTFSLKTLPDSHLPAFLFDCDRGSKALQGEFEKGQLRGMVPDVHDKKGKPIMYEQVAKRLDTLAKSDGPKTIVIDTLSRLYDSILESVLHTNNKGVNDPPSQPDYGIALRLTKRFVELLVASPFNIIVFAHERVYETEHGGITKGGPGLSGQLATLVPGYFDLVLHASVDRKGQHWWETRPKGIFIARSRLPKVTGTIPQDWSQFSE